MSATFTLDMIKTAVEKKYGTTNFELSNGLVCRLRNPIRLSEEERDALDALRSERKSDEEGGNSAAEQVSFLEDMLRIVSEDPAIAEQLFESVDHGVAELTTILEFWMEAQQAGEA